jgi:hypothetical protein
MKTPPAPPYLMAPGGSVIAEQWHGRDGAELGERLDHWIRSQMSISSAL